MLEVLEPVLQLEVKALRRSSPPVAMDYRLLG